MTDPRRFGLGVSAGELPGDLRPFRPREPRPERDPLHPPHPQEWSSDARSELRQQLASTSRQFTVDHLGVCPLAPRPMARRRQRQSRSFHRTCQGPRQGQGPSRLIGDHADHRSRKSLPEPRVRSGRPPIEGSRMSKSQTARKRATQAPSPTGQSETPPASPARQTEPLRVEPKSQTARKRATQAPSPTGQSETPPALAARETGPLRVEPKSQTARKRATQAPSPTDKSETPPASAARETEPLRVEECGIPASFSPRKEDRRPSSEAIAFRAYYLWLGRGQPVGTDWDDWLEAERQLVASA